MRDILPILERWTGEGTASRARLGDRANRLRSARSRRHARRLGDRRGGRVGHRRLRRAGRDPRGDRGAERLAAAASAATASPTTTASTSASRAAARSPSPCTRSTRRSSRRSPRRSRTDTSDRDDACALGEERFGEQRLVPGDGPAERRPVDAAARSLLELGESGIVETADGELVFVESYAPRPDMYIFGASDHVTALVTMGKFLGYRVTVCDPRATFLTARALPRRRRARRSSGPTGSSSTRRSTRAPRSA